MSKHQKRLSVPKSWPVERKTAVFTVKAGAGPHGRDGVPLLILLRDVLGYVDSKKEARYALNQGNILINGTAVSDEQRPVGMFDIVAFLERDEYYRVFPEEGGRLALTPIEAENAESKLAKITNKSTVAGGKTQLNLHDGSNILVDDPNAYGSNDSIVVSTDDKEVVAHFTYEEGSLVTAVSGQHAGEIGEITEIEVTPGSSSNNVTVTTDDGEFETIQDYVVVIDENFVGSDVQSTSENPNSAEHGSADHSSGQSPREDGENREGGEE